MLIDEVDIVASKGAAKEADEAVVVALANNDKASMEGGRFAVVGLLEDIGILAKKRASPGRGRGRGKTASKEVVDGDVDLNKRVECGGLREGVTKGSK